MWFLEKPEIWWPIIVFVTLVILFANNKLPTIDGFARFVALADSKGGNILILLILTMWTITMSVRFGYYAIHALHAAQVSGTPPSSDAVYQVILTWLTGSVSSGFMGALIKTMSGEHPAPTDKSQGDTNANPNQPKP